MYFCVPVGSAPELLSDMDDATVIAPEDGVMVCQLNRGDPKADIKWYKGNKQIYAGKKVVMDYKSNQGMLMVDATLVTSLWGFSWCLNE